MRGREREKTKPLISVGIESVTNAHAGGRVGVGGAEGRRGRRVSQTHD